MIRETLNAAYRFGRRMVILVVGVTVVLIGIVMIVTPGPATVVIPLGLAILSIEFLWARRLLAKMKEKAASALDAVKKKRIGS
jgi:tellurite resistance protein TerC